MIKQTEKQLDNGAETDGDVMTKLEKALENREEVRRLLIMTKLEIALESRQEVKRILIENACPSEFGLKDCENNPETGCSLCCEDCWEMELERNASAPEGRVKHIDGLPEDGPR